MSPDGQISGHDYRKSYDRCKYIVDNNNKSNCERHCSQLTKTGQESNNELFEPFCPLSLVVSSSQILVVVNVCTICDPSTKLLLALLISSALKKSSKRLKSGINDGREWEIWSGSSRAIATCWMKQNETPLFAFSSPSLFLRWASPWLGPRYPTTAEPTLLLIDSRVLWPKKQSREILTGANMFQPCLLTLNAVWRSSLLNSIYFS